VREKLFAILGLQLPAGRLRPAAAVAPAPGRSRRPVFSPGAAGYVASRIVMLPPPLVAVIRLGDVESIGTGSSTLPPPVTATTW